MKEQAIAKIRAEMEKDKANGNMRAAGEMLIQYLGQHAEAAAAVMADGVTLTKACQALHDEAKRRAGGKGSIWISDAEGFGIILEYFGIKAAGGHEPAAQETVPAAFDVDLNTLLGL